MFLGIRKRSRPELVIFFFVGPVSNQLAKFSTRRYPMSEISKKFKKFKIFQNRICDWFDVEIMQDK